MAVVVSVGCVVRLAAVSPLTKPVGVKVKGGFAEPAVFGTTLIDGRLSVSTSDYAAFTHLLPRVAAASRITLREVAPTDDSLESVFSYLVSR